MYWTVCLVKKWMMRSTCTMYIYLLEVTREWHVHVHVHVYEDLL